MLESSRDDIAVKHFDMFQLTYRKTRKFFDNKFAKQTLQIGLDWI